MWADPIVEEIHGIRRQLANECQDDLKKIVQRAVQRQTLRLVHQQDSLGKPPSSPKDLSDLIKPFT